ncbi:hypothetical protein Cgig2_012055 [Carnegiea gigantea]|uniref:AP2/ERF domain-containing protein n=1 Tax=Carnegiea gigantea TaxID=171969 RepID=A0A9Q1KQH1_9CARY|nr:hypothetical protein Cgig2_012055 [Carnegiea gigantea]
MVSLRRRRLLGLCLGVRNSFLSPLPRLYESGNAPENASRRSNPVSVHPMPMDDTKPPLEVNDPSSGIVASNVSSSSPSKHQSNQLHISSSVSNSSKEQNTRPTIEREVKHKKQHWRRHTNNQDQCVLRGVYFKNMKWQAAIKVGKKQIHLGTVSSRGEAAHLYDRAAFMCGREPNFELPEEEKQELKNFEWDEFLAMTRRATTSKSNPHTFRNNISISVSSFASKISQQKNMSQEPEGSMASEQEQDDNLSGVMNKELRASLPQMMPYSQPPPHYLLSVQNQG